MRPRLISIFITRFASSFLSVTAGYDKIYDLALLDCLRMDGSILLENGGMMERRRRHEGKTDGV